LSVDCILYAHIKLFSCTVLLAANCLLCCFSIVAETNYHNVTEQKLFKHDSCSLPLEWRVTENNGGN